MKDLKTASRMITERINETISDYSDNPLNLRNYAWGWRSVDENGISGAVGSNHGTAFYHMEDVVRILEACHCTYYMTIEPNADNVPTPCIRFF